MVMRYSFIYTQKIKHLISVFVFVDLMLYYCCRHKIPKYCLYHGDINLFLAWDLVFWLLDCYGFYAGWASTRSTVNENIENATENNVKHCLSCDKYKNKTTEMKFNNLIFIFIFIFIFSFFVSFFFNVNLS